ncbi:MAG: FliM/FliN family flagellar motor switch protein [Puniceicoccales bacterium]|jgi:flagellar motor switch/type III secretory pathway protein FliN|nr:FliM/FliN family flagellar motor switch protein [Puniceicoccales bacterium]
MADERENLLTDNEDLELDEPEETESTEEEKDEEWDEEASEEADEELTEPGDSLPEEDGEEEGDEELTETEDFLPGESGEEGADEEENVEESVEGQEGEGGAEAIDGEEGSDEALSPDAGEENSPSPEVEKTPAAVEQEMPAELPAEDRNSKAPTADAAHVKPAEATEVRIPEAFLHAEYRKGTRASVAQMPIRLTFEVGHQSIRLGDLESLQEGFLFEGGNPMDASVDICANGQLIGKGSLLNIEGRIGVRVTEIY